MKWNVLPLVWRLCHGNQSCSTKLTCWIESHILPLSVIAYLVSPIASQTSAILVGSWCSVCYSSGLSCSSVCWRALKLQERWGPQTDTQTDVRNMYCYHDDGMETRITLLVLCAWNPRFIGWFRFQKATQITKFIGPTWGPSGSCRPQMGPILAPWTLLSGQWCEAYVISLLLSWKIVKQSSCLRFKTSWCLGDVLVMILGLFQYKNVLPV